MTIPQAILTQSIRWAIRGAVLLGFAAGVVVLMLWLAGKFSPKVPATADFGQAQASAIEGQVASVQLVRLPLSESAVGTIRAVHETTIGSKLLARVVEVNLKAGQKVKAGDVLLRLDDTDLRAKLQQAKAAVASIEAARAQAAADEKRYASPDRVPCRQPPGIRKGRHRLAIRGSGSPASAGNRQRSASHARLGHRSLAHRRHGDRQESRRGRHGHAGPDARHALRSQTDATGRQRSRVA